MHNKLALVMLVLNKVYQLRNKLMYKPPYNLAKLTRECLEETKGRL